MVVRCLRLCNKLPSKLNAELKRLNNWPHLSSSTKVTNPNLAAKRHFRSNSYWGSALNPCWVLCPLGHQNMQCSSLTCRSKCLVFLCGYSWITFCKLSSCKWPVLPMPSLLPYCSWTEHHGQVQFSLTFRLSHAYEFKSVTAPFKTVTSSMLKWSSLQLVISRWRSTAGPIKAQFYHSPCTSIAWAFMQQTCVWLRLYCIIWMKLDGYCHNHQWFRIFKLRTGLLISPIS